MIQQQTLAFRTSKPGPGCAKRKREESAEGKEQQDLLLRFVQGIENTVLFYKADTTVPVERVLKNVSRLVKRTCTEQHLLQILAIEPVYMVSRRSDNTLIMTVPKRDPGRLARFLDKIALPVCPVGGIQRHVTVKPPSQRRLDMQRPVVEQTVPQEVACDTASRAMSLVERIRAKEAARKTRKEPSVEEIQKTNAKTRMKEVMEIVLLLTQSSATYSFSMADLTSKITTSMRGLTGAREAQDTLELWAEVCPQWCQVVRAGGVHAVRFQPTPRQLLLVHI